MLKFIRKYRQVLLVVAGVMLMVAFLVPGAIKQWADSRNNSTVMKIGSRKITALQYHDLSMEYELLAKLTGNAIQLMGVSEGPEQWILLSELAERTGYVGAGKQARDFINDIAMIRVRAQFGDNYNSLMANPQFRTIIEQQIANEAEGMRARIPAVAAEGRVPESRIDEGLNRMRGINRMLLANDRAARVSYPRTVLQARRDLEGANVDYIFVSAEKYTKDIATPDDATLQAFMDQYKTTKPGEGEFGVGYLLPPRVKLEYLKLDAVAIKSKVQPDLRDVRRLYNNRENKDEKFEDVRPRLESQLQTEGVNRIIAAAQEAIRAAVTQATLRLEDDGQFKVLPADWATKRPTMAQLAETVVKYVEEKTRPEPGKPGIKIDTPEVVVLDKTFLTTEDLAALPGIGSSSLARGQRQLPFGLYALSVHELMKNTPISLQVGVPCEEPTRDATQSVYYFTILETREESTPRSIDEIKDKLVADWKRVQAYKTLTGQESDALRQQAIASGIISLDEARKNPIEPGKPIPPANYHTAKVTRTTMSFQDKDLNTDSFRLPIIEAAEKLDPMTAILSVPIEQRTFVVPVPQKLGVAVVQIKGLVPLTVEDYRAQQTRLALQYQYEEYRSLKESPFTTERLRERLKVEFVGPDAEKRQNSIKKAS